MNQEMYQNVREYEFELFNGENYITFYPVEINTVKNEITVMVSDQGKISECPFDLKSDGKGYYFEYGVMYEKVYVDDFKQVNDEEQKLEWKQNLCEPVIKTRNYVEVISVKPVQATEVKASVMSDYAKCPRCEVNYMLKHEGYCKVCKPIMQNKSEISDEARYETEQESRWESYQANKESYDDFRAVRYNQKHLRRT